MYRTNLFADHGFVLWDSAWYGGHHVPGYSILFPPLAALLGVRVVGALSAVISAALFERLAREHFGGRAWFGAIWFAAATAMNLITGRLAFGLGITFALAAVLAATHRRMGLAALLAVATTLSSPVAGLFLGLGAIAWLLASRSAPALWFSVASIAPTLALIVLFPEGGTEPFVASSFWPALISCAFVGVALPRHEHTMRIGVVLYALACVAAFVIPSPVGGNVVRLSTLFCGPLLACLLWRRQMVFLALAAIPLLYWQWNAPVRDVVRADHDPATRPSYYQPLLSFLHAQGGPPFRIEIPFTTNHWEAAEVAPSFALARGWERQLDRQDNGIFYRPGLTAAGYRRWLGIYAVRYVALPNVRLDESAKAEAALLRRGQRWLQPVYRDARWRVWKVRSPTPLAGGAGTLTAIDSDSFTLHATRPGTIFVRERFTPYWAVTSGTGCVRQAPGGWTEVTVRGPGAVHVAARFSLTRVIDHGPRCSS